MVHRTPISGERKLVSQLHTITPALVASFWAARRKRVATVCLSCVSQFCGFVVAFARSEPDQMEWRQQSTFSCADAFNEARRWIEVSDMFDH